MIKYTPKLMVECPITKKTQTATVKANNIATIRFQAITIEDFFVFPTLKIAIIDATEADDNPKYCATNNEPNAANIILIPFNTIHFPLSNFNNCSFL